MIYISSPYTSPYSEVVIQRVERTKQFVFWLIQLGYHPLSIPIHYHDMSLEYPFDYNYKWWDAFCEPFLKRSDELFVLMLDGWLESHGIAEEIKLARELEIPIKYYLPTEESYILWTN
jgi:hypothetical protein